MEKDPEHWLHRFGPEEWIRVAMGEMKRAEEAYAAKNARAGLAGCRRAAGMALNGVLAALPNEAWGRSFMEHLHALAKDVSAPEAVREAAKLLVETPMAGGDVIGLRSPAGDRRIMEAAKDVMAHAYAIVMRGNL